MNLNDLGALYWEHQTLSTSLAILFAVGGLLLISNRMRKLSAHRATLLVANLLTVVAAVLATMVSASGMWKFFTDILGDSTLRYIFFWFIEIALFASALLARARLLRDAAAGTGIDGIAVWVFAALTASLSAMDSGSPREIALRLSAPMVAAYMWERALAAERSVQLGRTASRIRWAITLERVFVWLRLAEAQDRDVTEIDRARRRARLGQARLHLFLLQDKKRLAAWRLHRAHNKVIRRAMQAAEHIGLADFPDAASEREAIQMYMATIYGIVDATTPEAVAHLNAWPTTLSTPTSADVALADRGCSGPAVTAVTPTMAKLTHRLNDHPLPPADSNTSGDGQPDESDDRPEAETADGNRPTTARGGNGSDDTGEVFDDDEVAVEDGTPDDEADVSAVAAMRRFWDGGISQGRVPTGADLSRAAGVPPTTGLGRRKRRQWVAELPDHLRVRPVQAGERR